MNISDFDQYVGRYNRFVDTFSEETDRAAAVLAGGFIETFLASALRAHFVDHPRVHDLYSGQGALATFSARADVLLGIGLMSEEVYNDLRYSRKVRNHFARHPEEASFSTSPVRDLCTNLSTARPIVRSDGSEIQHAEPRHQFLLAVGMALLNIRQIVSCERRR